MSRIVRYYFFLIGIFVVLSPGVMYGESWKAEFERLCGYTEEATTLPSQKIRELIADCDRLLESMENVDDPQKKVYLFRLKKCRNFFEYIQSMKDVEKGEDKETLSPE